MTDQCPNLKSSIDVVKDLIVWFNGANSSCPIFCYKVGFKILYTSVKKKKCQDLVLH